MRPSQRQPGELRPLSITRGYTVHAEGSVMIQIGQTRVLCTASVETNPPPWQFGAAELISTSRPRRLTGQKHFGSIHRPVQQGGK